MIEGLLQSEIRPRKRLGSGAAPCPRLLRRAGSRLLGALLVLAVICPTAHAAGAEPIRCPAEIRAQIKAVAPPAGWTAEPKEVTVRLTGADVVVDGDEQIPDEDRAQGRTVVLTWGIAAPGYRLRCVYDHGLALDHALPSRVKTCTATLRVDEHGNVTGVVLGVSCE